MPRMADIQISVIPALRLRGSRKAGMPFEIASTPVRAEVPLEKACRIRNGVTAAAVSSTHGRRVDHVPEGAREVAEEAMPTVTNIMATKK